MEKPSPEQFIFYKHYSYNVFSKIAGSILDALIAGIKVKVMLVKVAKERLNIKTFQEKKVFRGVKKDMIFIKNILKIHPTIPLIIAIKKDIIR